ALILHTAPMYGQSTQRDLARDILQSSEVRGGLVVHLGCGDGTLTAALCANDRYVVHGLNTDAGDVGKARATIRSQGMYGKVSVGTYDGRHLPYADNLVNLVVSEDATDIAMDEVMRVLCPRGVAYIKKGDTWEKTVQPWPEEIDEWTHWLHDADGNAVANDTAVGPPRHARWIADPRWQRHHEMSPSLDAMVSAGGRLFAIINETPAGIDGLPDRWALVARDAFNGKLLWKRPIAEWGWRQWSDHSYGHGRWNLPTHIPRRLVAVGNRVYATLGFNAPLVALDAATGRTMMTYPESRFADEILYHQGTLILAINNAAQGPGHVDAKPPVTKSVVALDAESGRLLWKTGDFNGAASKADAIERITHLTMITGGGRVFLTEEDAVVALDLETGKRMWRMERSPQKKTVTYGHYYYKNLCSMVYHDRVVLFMQPDGRTKNAPWNGPVKATLSGISAATGDTLWTRPCGLWGHYNPGDLFVVDGLAWVHDGESFSMMGIDPKSGELKRELSTKEALDQGHHHRCYRNKATTEYFFTGRRGVETIEIESGENLRHHWVRGTCRYGVLPCNGLLYAPPHPCICYVTAKLTGLWALAPETKAESGKRKADDEARLERGPAYDRQATSLPTFRFQLFEDWPTYRHDPARSGAATTTVPLDLNPVWEASLDGRPSSPVIAEGKVLVTTPDTHTVWALDSADGKPLWSYTAGARVDSPPTVYRGRALFGSADGWVYCLRMEDGALAWRLRAAPDDTLIGVRDQLESPWPVHGNVLIRQGVAYFAAGRSSFLDGGIRVFAVDPGTGKVLQKQQIYSPDPETGDMVENRMRYDMPQDAPGALPDIMVGDATSVYMRHLRFDPADLQYASTIQIAPPPQKTRPANLTPGPHLRADAGLLDDSWFNQTYWTVDARSHSKLLVFDTDAAYGVKPFAASARHSRAVFKPGTEGYTLFAHERPSHQARWSKKVPVRIMAMVVAGETLFAAGSPDVVDPADPWAAINGRGGAVLWAVSTADGEKLAETKLDSPPIFNGMAAAGGRLYVSTTGGKVVCLGGR
ncbi:MAG: PQQ-binding-like beta-propeller repeat protein, partial [Planctomycetes bacterium]|nr:PQQ-binding-like beta-propeller repeat protein [Planctomycetota bacterium]